MVDKPGIRSLLAGIHNFALLVLKKVKVLVVLIDSFHAPVALALRNNFATILNYQAALLDRLHSLNSKAPLFRLLNPQIKRHNFVRLHFRH